MLAFMISSSIAVSSHWPEHAKSLNRDICARLAHPTHYLLENRAAKTLPEVLRGPQSLGQHLAFIGTNLMEIVSPGALGALFRTVANQARYPLMFAVLHALRVPPGLVVWFSFVVAL